MPQRGITPIVSYVLILTILIIIAVGSYIWASYMQNKLQDNVVVSVMQNEMISLGNLVENVAHGDINYTSTMTVYYPSGLLEVDPDRGWIEYITQTQSQVYPIPTELPPASVDKCNSTASAINDTDTGITLVKLPFTHFYRGATGGYAGERVEQVVCFPDIQIVAGNGCLGKSGPSSQVIIKKIGYNGTKPVVQVGVC